MKYEKHKGWLENVPSVIVKLVPPERAETLGAVSPVSAVVLQVTESSDPRLESGCTKIALLAVTAVVSITHVLPDCPVPQENEPLGAAEQATVPEESFAAHFVALA
jgi:hypothetical protein